MICEGTKPDYNDVIQSASMRGRLVCEHDFWDKAKLIDYGDVILCQRCGQYFTKIRHMIWIVKGKEVLEPHPGIQRMILKPKANHKNVDCFVRVPVRITDVT